MPRGCTDSDTLCSSSRGTIPSQQTRNCFFVSRKLRLAKKMKICSVLAFICLARTGTASCSVSGPPLAIGMKPQALFLRHRPVSAFIGLNRLSQDISSIAAELKGPYKSGFNTLVEKASVVTEYVSFLTVFVGAVATAKISYTLILTSHQFGRGWAGATGVVMVVVMTSPFWTKPFRKSHASSVPAQQSSLSPQAIGSPQFAESRQ